MRRLTIFLYLLLFSSSIFAQNRVEDYVKHYKDLAISEMNRTGIPASIIMGQAIIHSTFGNDPVALIANNHFAVRCEDDWAGETFYKHITNAKGKPDCYKKFNTDEDSYREHTDNIINDERFERLFVYSNTEYKKWAKGLERNGYSELSKDYSKELIGVIEQFNLQQYDGQTTMTPQLTDAVAAKETGEYEVNGVKALKYTEDQMPFTVAMAYGIPLNKILEYNEVENEEDLKLGSNIFIEKKKRKYTGDHVVHRVNRGESLHQISQQYGIKLKRLYAINDFDENKILRSGEMVKLYKNIDASAAGGTYADRSKPSPPKPVITQTQPTPPPSPAEEPSSPVMIGGYTGFPSPPQMPGGTRTYVYPEYDPTPLQCDPQQTEADNNMDKPRPPKPVFTREQIEKAKEQPNPLIDRSAVHVVTKNDTLYSLSKKYNMSVANIKRLNGLKDNNIHVGQKLIIEE